MVRERPLDCLKALWQRLNETERLDQFFSNGLLLVCVKPNTYGQLCLIPQLPPEHLSEAVQNQVLSAAGFDNPSEGSVWNGDWSWWNDFICPSSAEEWLNRHFDSDDNVKGAWQGLLGIMEHANSGYLCAATENLPVVSGLRPCSS